MPAGTNTAPHVRCLLMQKDEQDLLPLWIRYHGELFGYDNLYIWDNGSGPETRTILESAVRDLGVHADFSRTTQEDFENKGTIFAGEISRESAAGAEAFFLPLDCDEFVGVRVGSSYSCSPLAVRNELDLFPVCVEACFRVDQRLDNSRDDASVFHLVNRTGKLFFGSTKVEGLGVGFHECALPSQSVPTQLVYFHLHNRPFAEMVSRARQKMQVRFTSPSPTHEEMLGYRGSGEHLAKFLTMTEQEYAGWLAAHPTVGTTALRDRFAQLGLGLPWTSRQSGGEEFPH